MQREGRGHLLGAIAVVLVQRRAVDGPPQRAGDERVLHADAVDEEGGEHAKEAHEAEDERIARVDLGVLEFEWMKCAGGNSYEVGLKRAACAQRVVCILGVVSMEYRGIIGVAASR